MPAIDLGRLDSQRAIERDLHFGNPPLRHQQRQVVKHCLCASNRENRNQDLAGSIDLVQDFRPAESTVDYVSKSIEPAPLRMQLIAVCAFTNDVISVCHLFHVLKTGHADTPDVATEDDLALAFTVSDPHHHLRRTKKMRGGKKFDRHVFGSGETLAEVQPLYLLENGGGIILSVTRQNARSLFLP